MKTINLHNSNHKQISNEYCIALGNGARLSFKSKREMAAFVAETNRYLTKVLVVLNETYTCLFAEYRSFWLVASNTSGGTRTNYISICTKTKSMLDAAGDVFEKFSSQYRSADDPFFSFIDLRKICVFLKEAAEHLAAIHKKRNHTANYYSCVVYFERMIVVQEKLLNYGV